jgi:hypothetical protein
MNMLRTSHWIVLIAACCGIAWCVSNRNLRYEEQVQLATGEVIRVNRVIETAPMGELGGPGGWDAKYNSLSVVDARTPPPPKWESEIGLIPLLIDRDAKSEGWYLVATFYTCEPWRALGKPKLPYAEFRSSGEKWEQVPLSPELMGREANVLTTINFKGERSPVTLADKQARNSDPAIEKSYLKIVDSGRSGC